MFAYFGAYLTIGMLVVFGAGEVLEFDADAPPRAGPAIALCVVALLLLAAALRQWRQPPNKEPPALFAKLEEFTPAKALAVGALVPVINVKNLAIYLPAITVLAGASLDPMTATLAVSSTAMIFCGGLLTPVAIYLLLPQRAAAWLGAMRRWIEANSSVVARIVLPLIACLLLAKGGHTLWLLFGP